MDFGVLDNLLRNISFEIEHQRRLPKRFNVFDIVGIGGYETYHSMILAGLLRWNGSRKPLIKFLEILMRRIENNENISVNNRFLIDFLENLKNDKDKNDLKDVVVTTEHTIDIGSEKRRFDILLKIGRKLYIVIENKVKTDDHSDQLNAYRRWLNEHCEHGILVYLTLNGDASSEGFSGDYIRLSYRNDIREFLTACAEMTNLDERFNSTALQYAEFWENWFMGSDELKQKVVNEILKSKENYEAAEQIFHDFLVAKYQMIVKLLQLWQNSIYEDKEYGYEPKVKPKDWKIVEKRGKDQYEKMSFKWNDNYSICFEFAEQYCTGLFFGVFANKQSEKKEMRSFIGWKSKDRWPAYQEIEPSNVRDLGYNSSLCFTEREEIFNTLTSAFDEVLKLLNNNEDYFGKREA